MSGSTSAIAVDRLGVRHGDLQAVDGVTFSVDPGEVVALLGPNGAGKTTTIETIEGFRRPDEGTVRVLDVDPVDDNRAVMSRTGVMLQEGGVPTGMRPLEALRLFAAYYDHPLDPVQLLDRVGLSDRTRVTWRRLSGGEKQRLSLALALVGQPQVVLLDEPTSGVDVGGRQLIRTLISELAEGGAAVLLATHELDEAERMADRVVVMDRGAIVAQGTLDELGDQSGATSEVQFTARPALDVASLSAALEVEVCESQPGRYQVSAPGTPALLAELTRWLAQHDAALGDLQAGRHRLEDLFLRLTATAESTP